MKNFILITLLSLVGMNTFAQAPGKMTYQSLIRDNQSNLFQNHSVGVRFTIVQDGISQTSVFEETHVASTNINGLLTLEIGAGTNNFGAIQNIDWENGPYLIKTAIDPTGGANYSIFGESSLVSVPYALHANIADSSNHAPMDGNDPAFAGWDKNESDDFDGLYGSLGGAPSNVSAFVNDAGYLTTELDGSTTNELQNLSLNGTSLSISNGNSVSLNPLVNDSDWVMSGTDIFRMSGNVGIGNANPLHKLSINGKLRVHGLQSPVNGQGAYLDWNHNPTSTANGLPLNQGMTHILNQRGTGPGGFSFDLFDGSNNHVSSPLTISSNGNTGIGTSQPTERLDVDGNLNVKDDIKLDGQTPITFKRYPNLGDSPNFTTTFPIAEYDAGITGFRALNGDIDEFGPGDIIQAWMEPNPADGLWHIRANFRSHTYHENWYVDVMFVRKGISTRSGY